MTSRDEESVGGSFATSADGQAEDTTLGGGAECMVEASSSRRGQEIVKPFADEFGEGAAEHRRGARANEPILLQLQDGEWELRA